MKVIIAGSRNFPTEHSDIIWGSIAASNFDITEVVSGGAIGADRFGEVYAQQNNIPVKKFLPDWNRYGRSAGFLRNWEMANYADALIAIWDGKSNGTRNMIGHMKRLGKPLEVIKTGGL